MSRPMTFRAMHNRTRGDGALQVEAQFGSEWRCTVGGLSPSQVRKQFETMRAHGARIVDTEDFRMEDNEHHN